MMPAAAPIAAFVAGVVLAGSGVALVLASLWSGAAWHGFGACFTAIGVLLIVQGGVGAMNGPGRSLTA